MDIEGLTAWDAAETIMRIPNPTALTEPIHKTLKIKGATLERVNPSPDWKITDLTVGEQLRRPLLPYEISAMLGVKRFGFLQQDDEVLKQQEFGSCLLLSKNETTESFTITIQDWRGRQIWSGRIELPIFEISKSLPYKVVMTDSNGTVIRLSPTSTPHLGDEWSSLGRGAITVDNFLESSFSLDKPAIKATWSRIKGGGERDK
jgi:hypothetical protein